MFISEKVMDCGWGGQTIQFISLGSTHWNLISKSNWKEKTMYSSFKLILPAILSFHGSQHFKGDGLCFESESTVFLSFAGLCLSHTHTHTHALTRAQVKCCSMNWGKESNWLFHHLVVMHRCLGEDASSMISWPG